MYDFLIAVGHTASGNAGCGAVDNLDESNCTRQIAPLTVNYLESAGKSVGLLRIDRGNTYNCEDCYTRADQANNLGAEWYVEIHLNSGKEHTGDGAEVCICSSNPEVQAMAERVSESVANALSIDNRGVKKENLIVLKRTYMKAILVECMFVDGDDPNRYNADNIARAIAEGLLGATIEVDWKQGWNQRGNRWFYCTDVNNKYYYSSSWQYIDTYWYLFDCDGWCVTGWKEYNGIWYYLDPTSCQMATGWKQVAGEWYYFNSNGAMQTGWIKDGNKDYYLYSDGPMAHDCDLYGYRFVSDGSAIKIE